MTVNEIAAYIAARGLSQARFAALAELDPGSLSKVLSGRRSMSKQFMIQVEYFTMRAYMDGDTDVPPLRRDRKSVV